MASGLFDFSAEGLERHSSLDRLQARGTLRLALKKAGLDLEALSLRELVVILEKVMPGELQSVGIKNAEEICGALIQDLNSDEATDEAAPSASVQDIFDRLGRDT